MSAEIKKYLEQLVRWQDEHFPHEPTAQRFVLQHGRSFEFNNASFTEAGEQQQCYKNATERALYDSDVTYCEGYVDAVIPLEHAWLIDKTGKVIDPTIRNTGHVGGYFGVPIQREFLRKALFKNKRYGIFDWRHKDWKRVNPDKVVERINDGKETKAHAVHG